MNPTTFSIMNRMTDFFRGRPKQIQHFLKVSSFCEAIAIGEMLDGALRQRLVIAGLVHDIGIRVADEKYGSHEGPLQEQEGPAAARPLLEQSGCSPEEVDRLCWLIAHHHTYNNITEKDHQILVEADFLVNAYEDGLSKDSIRVMRDKIFRTATGTVLLNTMFDL